MMDQVLYAADLAGHCNELTAWRIIKQVSGQLMSHGAMPVSPFNIKINEDGSFALTENTEAEIDTFMAPEATAAAPTMASWVWSLAASVFYAVMGCQVMNGRGGRAQHAASKVPYMRSELPQLSELVQKCLNYRPEQRPTMLEVNQTAAAQLQRCEDLVRRGPKLRQNIVSRNISMPSGDNCQFWPEAFVLMLLFFSLGFKAMAQTSGDNELQRLIGVVCSMRQSDEQSREKAWNDAARILENDKQWTIMDEVTPHPNECRITDRSLQWFALNRMLSRQMGYEMNQVRGDFNNGEDPDFNYSLIERSVKANATVSYMLKSREGEQIFVVIPYDTQAASLETALYRGDTLLAQGVRHDDGNIYLIADRDYHVVMNDVLKLVITNKSSANTAMVIINHNTRIK